MKSAKSFIAASSLRVGGGVVRHCCSKSVVPVINMKQSNLDISNETATKLYIKIHEESPEKPMTVASLEQNSVRNRWFNVLPFDDCRIKLKGNNTEHGSSEHFNDYINASR